MNISNRVFGADIIPEIKQKLKHRQSLNKSADFGESVQTIDRESYISDFKEGDSALADLSSRTPFARMWTYVTLTAMSKPELCGGKGEKSCNYEDDNWIINDTVDGKKQREIVGSYNKFYQIGNHTLNMLQNMDVNVPVDTADNETEELPDELAVNPFLKPPAGIISVSSETMGTLGALKSVSVNFVVNNFQDFEKIYSRYFLKHGATIFIDYGWSTSDLYDPNELIKESDIDGKLFGTNGFISKTEGDIDTVYGYVTNYDAKIKENGSVECSITVVSKNSALLSVGMSPTVKEELLAAIKKLTDWITWGEFEDEYLNQYFGFGDSGDSLSDSKFSSEGLYVRYNPELASQSGGGALEQGNIFQFPNPPTKEHSPDYWSTYTEDTGKIDPRPDQKTEQEQSEEETKHPRVPVRLMAVHKDVLFEVLDKLGNGASPEQYINDILSKINSSTSGILELALFSNTYSQSTLGITDIHYVKDVDNDNKQLFEGLFTFKPGSPNTIVKTYDLTFQTPKNELQSMIAIQNAGPGGSFFPSDKKQDRSNANEIASKPAEFFTQWFPTGDRVPAAANSGVVIGTAAYKKQKEIEFSYNISTIVPLSLTLGIYGISSLAPGDLLKVDYLPEEYTKQVFFQITKVSHDISTSTWTTTLETVQRLSHWGKANSSLYAGASKSDSEGPGDKPGSNSNAPGSQGIDKKRSLEISAKRRADCRKLKIHGLQCTEKNLENLARAIRLSTISDEQLEINRKKANTEWAIREYAEEIPTFMQNTMMDDFKETTCMNDPYIIPRFENITRIPEGVDSSKKFGIESFRHIKTIWYLKNSLTSNCEVKIPCIKTVGCNPSWEMKGRMGEESATRFCEFGGYGYNHLLDKAFVAAATKYDFNVLGAVMKNTESAFGGTAMIEEGHDYYLIISKHSNPTIAPDGYWILVDLGVPPEPEAAAAESERAVIGYGGTPATSQAISNKKDWIDPYDINVSMADHRGYYKANLPAHSFSLAGITSESAYCDYGWVDNYDCKAMAVHEYSSEYIKIATADDGSGRSECEMDAAAEEYSWWYWVPYIPNHPQYCDIWKSICNTPDCDPANSFDHFPCDIFNHPLNYVHQKYFIDCRKESKCFGQAIAVDISGRARLLDPSQDRGGLGGVIARWQLGTGYMDNTTQQFYFNDEPECRPEEAYFSPDSAELSKTCDALGTVLSYHLNLVNYFGPYLVDYLPGRGG